MFNFVISFVKDRLNWLNVIFISLICKDYTINTKKMIKLISYIAKLSNNNNHCLYNYILHYSCYRGLAIS